MLNFSLCLIITLSTASGVCSETPQVLTPHIRLPPACRGFPHLLQAVLEHARQPSSKTLLTPPALHAPCQPVPCSLSSLLTTLGTWRSVAGSPHMDVLWTVFRLTPHKGQPLNHHVDALLTRLSVWRPPLGYHSPLTCADGCLTWQCLEQIVRGRKGRGRREVFS